MQIPRVIAIEHTRTKLVSAVYEPSGVGIFMNIDWHFPMPEVMGWLEWKPVLEP